jgi:hypothetical protein
MKRLIFTMAMALIICNSFANTVSLEQQKQSQYDEQKVLSVMEKYRIKYGNTDSVNLVYIYHTIAYYAYMYDIDIFYALTFFAIESGYSCVCKSSYNAVGIGQVTEIALADYNSWYNEDISFSYLNDATYYQYNIKVALGYLRLCWDKYKIIDNGDDLMRSYNIGITNLKNIKNGNTTRWEKINGEWVDYWKYASDKYADRFYECYSEFMLCKTKL